MATVVAAQVVGCRKAEAAADAGAPTSPKEPATVVGAVRPGCVLPPRILTPERAHLLGSLGKASLGWILGRYEEAASDGGADPAEKDLPELVESDYLSALPPGKAIRLIPTGLARVDGVREWWKLGPKTFKVMKAGVLSDHCPTRHAANENTMLFSLALSKDLLLQAVVQRGSEPFIDEPYPDQMKNPYGLDDKYIPKSIYAKLTEEDRKAYPIITVRLRVERITKDGRTTISESPKLKVASTSMMAVVLGDSANAPVAIGFTDARAVLVVTRDGRIPFSQEDLCSSRELPFVTFSRSTHDPYRLLVFEASIDGKRGRPCREQAEIDKASALWEAPVSNSAPFDVDGGGSNKGGGTP